MTTLAVGAGHMSRLLIVYGTRFGQTAKIAEWVGDVLRARGCAVTVADAAHLPRDVAVDAFDRVIYWRPTRTATVAGALAYSRYAPPLIADAIAAAVATRGSGAPVT